MPWSQIAAPMVGAVGALLAAGFGAWWQARNSNRMLRWQAFETSQIRRHQTWHAQVLQLFNDKRTAYIQLISLAAKFGVANKGLAEMEWMPFDESEWGQYLALDAEAEVENLAQQVDDSLTTLEILAPANVYDAALKLCLAGLSDDPRLSAVLSIYVDEVRRDLGTNLSLDLLEGSVAPAMGP